MNNLKGAIYGVFVGDALGTTYEFKKSSDVKLPVKLNIVGGGPFHVAKGQVTDDSEMTLALLYSILKKKKYDKEDVAKAYIRWLKSEPKDNGITTAKALRNAKNYKDTVNNSIRLNSGSKSNGFLMRIAPLTILGLENLDKIIQEDVVITHSNKACYYTAKLYIYMLIYIINKGKDYKKEALRIIDLDEHQDVINLKHIVNSAEKTPYYRDIKIDGHMMGFMYVSLQIAFHYLYHSKDYENAFKSIFKLGGDTDTNGAIAGAFLGAKFGYNKIPKRWIKTLEEADYDRPQEFKIKKIF